MAAVDGASLRGGTRRYVAPRCEACLRVATWSNYRMPGRDLLGGPPEALLPADRAVGSLHAGDDPADVAAEHPESSLAWAVLATGALRERRYVEAYAYARTGYHRGLDLLRRNGWKGHGFIPWSHEPNRGFLTALYCLARAAEAIHEDAEAERCYTFLRESSEDAEQELREWLDQTDVVREDGPG